MEPIRFEIPGDPVPQPRARFAVKNGIPKPYTKRGHPIIPFRQAVEHLARAAGPGATLGPFVIEIEAIFARPKSHWTRSGLAPKAPAFPGKNCGDVDNIGKGVKDAITEAGTIWHDDTQVVDERVQKRYASRLEAARTIVRIRSA